jgi:hypothetical protein
MFWQRKILRFFLTLLLLPLCACGPGTPLQIGSKQSQLAGTPQNYYPSQNTFNNFLNFNTPGTNNNTISNPTNLTPALNNASSSCNTQLQSLVQQVTIDCGSVINQYASILNQDYGPMCVQTFNALSSTQCANLSSEVANLKNFCGQPLSDNQSYLPSQCLTDLRQL